MSNIAIRVENLSKIYRIGTRDEQPRGLAQAARSLVASPFAYLQRMRRPPTEAEILWALRDVSFEVKHGEVLGIIGRNGAGKSTLLKILSRITEPTGGQAQVYGRVGSLLEVGTGFHPELTGRENIYLNGAILGMKRTEIERKFDEIVDFSGVEKFLDTPVKRYSSGMYVRLAFAVAAHLEPEILVIDEVLAVGDAAFQKKCMDKMGDVAKQGRTVLFVSHNMVALRHLCTTACLFQAGYLVKMGTVSDLVQLYLGTDRSDGIASISSMERKGSGGVRITEIAFINAAGTVATGTSTGDDCGIAFRYQAKEVPMRIQFAYGLITSLGEYCLHCSTHTVGSQLELRKEDGWIVCSFGRFPLVPGLYRVNFMLQSVTGDLLDYVQNAGGFEVSPGPFYSTNHLPHSSLGSVLVDYEFSVMGEDEKGRMNGNPHDVDLGMV